MPAWQPCYRTPGIMQDRHNGVASPCPERMSLSRTSREGPRSAKLQSMRKREKSRQQKWGRRGRSRGVMMEGGVTAILRVLRAARLNVKLMPPPMTTDLQNKTRARRERSREVAMPHQHKCRAGHLLQSHKFRTGHLIHPHPHQDKDRDLLTLGNSPR